jgi:adenylate cyclase class IV
VEKTVGLFKALNVADEIQESFQTRRNFIYKRVELAVKYSNTWDYHVELEQVVSDESEKETAEQAIRDVADELGLSLMTEKELQEFTEKKNAEVRSSNQSQ